MKMYLLRRLHSASQSRISTFRKATPGEFVITTLTIAETDNRNLNFYNRWYYSQGVVSRDSSYSHAPIELCRTDRAGNLQFVADLNYAQHTILSLPRKRIFYKLFGKGSAGPCTGEGLTSYTEFAANTFEMNTLEMRSICTPSNLPPFMCMKDDENNRTFPDYLKDPTLLLQAADMSIQKCQEHCASKSYAIAGLQGGSYCFCGKSFQAIGRYSLEVPAAQCNKPCPTAPGNCGTEGSSLIQAYKSGFVEPIPTSICLQDNDASKVFTDYQNTDPALQGWGMTAELCRNQCKTKNFGFAGLQNGRDCYCGNYSQIKGPSVSLD